MRAACDLYAAGIIGKGRGSCVTRSLKKSARRAKSTHVASILIWTQWLGICNISSSSAAPPWFHFPGAPFKQSNRPGQKTPSLYAQHVKKELARVARPEVFR